MSQKHIQCMHHCLKIDKEDHGINLISGMYVSKTESEEMFISGASINDKYLWLLGCDLTKSSVY